MDLQPYPRTDWWHERPTKAADLSATCQALARARQERDAVWKKGALIVGLMFAFILSLVSMVQR